MPTTPPPEIEEILKNARKETSFTMKDDGIFYEKPTVYRFTKQELADLLDQELQKAREQRDEQWREAIKYLINNSEGSQEWYSALRACRSIELDQPKSH